jgi:hypothetical protein
MQATFYAVLPLAGNVKWIANETGRVETLERLEKAIEVNAVISSGVHINHHQG